jgi:hypothetical protein
MMAQWSRAATWRSIELFVEGPAWDEQVRQVLFLGSLPWRALYHGGGG